MVRWAGGEEDCGEGGTAVEIHRQRMMRLSNTRVDIKSLFNCPVRS